MPRRVPETPYIALERIRYGVSGTLVPLGDLEPNPEVEATPCLWWLRGVGGFGVSDSVLSVASRCQTWFFVFVRPVPLEFDDDDGSLAISRCWSRRLSVGFRQSAKQETKPVTAKPER